MACTIFAAISGSSVATALTIDQKLNVVLNNAAIATTATDGFLYLAMEVRTGKTLTALSALDHIVDVNEMVFVTKKKAIAGIQKDYKALAPKYKCTFINYESLHKLDVSKIDAIVFDEAHTAWDRFQSQATGPRRPVPWC